MRNRVLCLSCCCAIFALIGATPVQTQIRSDLIVTKWPKNQQVDPTVLQQNDDKSPGWLRRQLMRFGEVTSRIGNALGTHTAKITGAIDKICDVVKTIIPFLAAVCQVGQFQFCAANDAAPNTLGQALSPQSLNLDELDKK